MVLGLLDCKAFRVLECRALCFEPQFGVWASGFRVSGMGFRISSRVGLTTLRFRASQGSQLQASTNANSHRERSPGFADTGWSATR